jgi:hypothetical protein
MEEKIFYLKRNIVRLPCLFCLVYIYYLMFITAFIDFGINEPILVTTENFFTFGCV